MQSNGIVHGPSQVYPNALEQRPIPGGESHVGETKSSHTRRELDYFAVQVQWTRAKIMTSFA